MGLTAALHRLADSGGVIVSNNGRRITAAEIEPITKLGQRAVSCRSFAVTDSEAKGEWAHETGY